MSKVDRWYLYNGLVYCGILSYDEDTQTFSFKIENDCARTRAAIQALNLDKDPKWCRETIFDRVFPPNRVDARRLLNKIGLVDYDAWEIVKYVHLMNSNDMVWMNKEKNTDFYFKNHPASRIVSNEIASNPNIFA